MKPTDESLDDGRWEAAMRAAFAEAEGGAFRAGMTSVLHETLGLGPGLLLKDAEDFETPVVRVDRKEPAREAPAAGAGRLGRYQILGEIARGGVGVVLKGRDGDLGRDVALKILRPEHRSNRSVVHRFVEEAQIAGQLQHPGILPIYELGLDQEERPFFSMKLVKGRTLAALLKEAERGPSGRHRLLQVFLKVCQTMAYAHARGVVHRDLKPSNVMVGAFGEVQVLDWGLAKVLIQGGLADDRPQVVAGDAAVAEDASDDAVEKGETLTDPREEERIRTLRGGSDNEASLAGSVMGTPAYMSPEQARGDHQRVRETADVYALGAILLEILTGHPPFSGPSREMMAAAAQGDLSEAFMRLAACDADARWVELTRRCLAPAPADRPANAAEVAREIETHEAELEQRARKLEIEAAASQARALQERRARRWTTAFGGSILLLAIVIAAAVGLVRREQGRVAEVGRQSVAGALQKGYVALGEARGARSAQNLAWRLARMAGEQVQARAAEGPLDAATREQVDQFLDELEAADRDQQMVGLIEGIVVRGSTHDDVETWLTMDRALEEAFIQYGLDVHGAAPAAVAAAIAESPIRDPLAHGMDLWTLTGFYLFSKGEGDAVSTSILRRLDIVMHIDFDPLRSAIRRATYSGLPDRDALTSLADAPELEQAPVEAWLVLGSALGFTGGPDAEWKRFHQKMLARFPDNFMAHFNYAFFLLRAGETAEAVAHFTAAAALRPDNDGIWHTLGQALRQAGHLEESESALRRSLDIEPGIASTQLDLGLVLEEAGRLDDAASAYREAVRLSPAFAAAYCRLGLLYRRLGKIPAAVEALSMAHRLGAAQPDWPHPTAEWLRALGVMELSEPADPMP